MSGKVNGPTVADILRHMKAAKRMGVPAIATNIGGSIIVIPIDSSYLEKLALGQPPAQSSEEGVKEVKTLW
jgi:hypothetical protein